MKRANPKKWICSIEKTISQDFILDMKRVLYSRYQKLRGDDFFFKQADFN